METIVLTGAGGVLGTAIALRLSKRGASIVLADMNDSALQGTLDAIRLAEPASRTEVRTCVADLTQQGAADRLVEYAVDVFGGVTVCINAAGLERPVIDSTKLTTAAMLPTFSVNVFALVELCAASIRSFLRAGTSGRIVNLASGAALSGAAHMVTYNSSKHAVLGATRSLAREFAHQGIAVNAVCPGFVESRMVTTILDQLQLLSPSTSDPLATIPAGRFARPDEIAAVVEFLTFDAPLYMTGSALVVDGALNA